MDARRLGFRGAALVGAALWLLCAAPVAAEPDAWVTAKVKLSLLASADVGGLAIDVDTRDGVVALHGAVASEAERARGEQLAADVAGVRDVRNLLQVVPERARKAVAAADAVIRRQVEDVLERDPALADSEIHVASVTDGVVVLAGRAASVPDHLRALDDARGVSGVRRAASEIESPDRAADEEIRRDDARESGLGSAARDSLITSTAVARLLARSGFGAFDIDVDPRRGIVTLFGTVPSSKARAEAEREVARADGVRAVINELQVVPKPVAEIVKQKDARLKEAVIDRLAASDELEDATIDVGVSDGVVRLSGSVVGQRDHRTALAIAGATSGARSVLDDLAVDPEPREVSAGES